VSKLVNYPLILFVVSLVALWFSAQAGDFLPVRELQRRSIAGQHGVAVGDDCLQRLGRRLWVTAISLPDRVQRDQLSTEEIQTMLVSK